MITETDVIELISLAETLEIEVFLDGGWGVDALLGKQTREHNDIDLFIEKRKAELFIEKLQEKGFKEIREAYTTISHTVWGDDKCRVVDLHLFEYGKERTFIFEGKEYPADIFSAIGWIGGKQIHCIPAKEQILFHLGYDFDEKDVQDVRLLCKRFNIPLPKEYVSTTLRTEKNC